MRGKLLLSSALAVGQRITPAGAGKTNISCAKFRQFTDHPRRCGENLEYVGNACSETGSPPQVRGKPDKFGSSTQYVRITPAGAGKTTYPTWWILPLEGSPPQVRGKQILALRSYAKRRITPAGAGKTTIYSQSSRTLQDHPRRCGENKLM